MTAVIVHPNTFEIRVLTFLPIIFWLLEIRIIKIISGGAQIPFSMAV